MLAKQFLAWLLQNLYEFIAAAGRLGQRLIIQTMEVADEDKFDFDSLDDTKIWPEDIFPLQPVGHTVLHMSLKLS